MTSPPIIDLGDDGGSVNTTTVSSEQSSCPICLEEFGNDSNNNSAIYTSCNHRFHYSCINGWMGRGMISCPICRHDISGSQQYDSRTMGFHDLNRNLETIDYNNASSTFLDLEAVDDNHADTASEDEAVIMRVDVVNTTDNNLTYDPIISDIIRTNVNYDYPESELNYEFTRTRSYSSIQNISNDGNYANDGNIRNDSQLINIINNINNTINADYNNRNESGIENLGIDNRGIDNRTNHYNPTHRITNNMDNRTTNNIWRTHDWMRNSNSNNNSNRDRVHNRDRVRNRFRNINHDRNINRDRDINRERERVNNERNNRTNFDNLFNRLRNMSIS